MHQRIQCQINVSSPDFIQMNKLVYGLHLADQSSAFLSHDHRRQQFIDSVVLYEYIPMSCRFSYIFRK